MTAPLLLTAMNLFKIAYRNLATRILVLCLAWWTLPASFVSAKANDPIEPELIGLYFYANWCSSCAALEPKIESASDKLKKEPFLLVKLDVSNKPKQHQANMTASALGLGKVYQKTGVKTGFVLLVDPKTGEILDRITKDDSPESIVEKMKKGLS